MMMRGFSGSALTAIAFLAVAPGGTKTLLPVEDGETPRIEVPLNQIMILQPFDKAQVEQADLEVTIASGYGVLTFVSITLNGKKVIEMANIDAGGIETIVVPGQHLKPGKNRLSVDSWHQMPGQTQRLEEFTAPEITLQVTRAKPSVPKKPAAE